MTSHDGSSRKYRGPAAVTPTTLCRLASDPPNQRFLHSLGQNQPLK
jgi:hypothetical protein